MTERREHIFKLNELIKDVKFAMLTTLHEDQLRSRPMAAQEMDDEGNLWFLTREHSAKIEETEHNPHVNVSYALPDDRRYVSVSGTAELVHDQAKIKELWNPIYKAWFPNGLEDPELALLKIHVTGAEFWDSPNGRMVQIAGFLKAIATGKAYEASNKEHQKIDLDRAS